MNQPVQLPRPLSSFVGRRSELAELTKLVADNRLVTIVGPGGAGKTRLSTELASRARNRFGHGVIFADLTPVQLAGTLPAQVAAAAGIAEKAGQPLLATIVEQLASGSRLLILDNCEQVTEGAAQIAQRLLQGCPELTILATSRQPLELAGEVTWRIPPLSVDAGRDYGPALTGSDAVQLFAERAGSRQPGYQLTDRSSSTVASICRRLDGLPLAIELASAWVGILGEAEILERVTGDLSLLEVRGFGRPERHRTMAATIEWSHKLLDDHARRVFACLGVFAGSFDLAAAQTVAEDKDALQAISALVSQSLVVAETAPDRPTRYRLLETVRQFALLTLKGSPGAGEVHNRHSLHYLSVAEAAEKVRDTPEAVGWMKRLGEEANNLRVALEWLLPADPEAAVQLAGALGWYWESVSSLEGSAWLNRALAHPTELNTHRSRAADWAGWMEIRRMNLPDAERRLREGLDISTAIGDRVGIARALIGLGPVARLSGRREESRSMVEQGLALVRGSGDARIEGGALTTLGVLAFDDGELDLAAELLVEANDLYNRRGSIAAMTLLFLGAVKHKSHDHPAALEVLHRTLEGFESVADTGGMAMALELVAMVADHLDLTARFRLSAAGQAMLDRAVVGRPPFWDEDLNSWRESAKQELGTRWEQLWAQGSSMTPEQALRLARSDGSNPGDPLHPAALKVGTGSAAGRKRLPSSSLRG